MIIHIGAGTVTGLVPSVPSCARDLHRALLAWPFVLDFQEGSWVPHRTTWGLDGNVRMPDHPVALKLIVEAQVPCGRTGCQCLGRRPRRRRLTSTGTWREELIIIVVAPLGIGVESTVLDTTSAPPMVLRRGCNREELRRFSVRWMDPPGGRALVRIARYLG